MSFTPEHGGFVDWRSHCTLHHGDFAETLALCRGQADLVFTSPPYADARTYGMACSWTMDDYHRLGVAVFAALKPGGHALINVDAPVREWRPGFGTERGFHPWRMMLDWAEDVGFRVPDRLAFGRQGMPGAYSGRFRNDWEPLLWFQRPGAFSWIERPRHVAKFGSAKAGLTSSTRVDGTKVRRMSTGRAVAEGTIERGTYWGYGVCGNGHTTAPDIERQGHPARWPYLLAEDVVRCFCPPGGLACDPFVGSGASAAASLENGRNFVGGDMGSRQDNEDNRSRGLDPVPWVTVVERVLDGRFSQARLF